MTTIERRPFDVRAIRRDFPILKREINGKELVYPTTRRPHRSPFR
jgi:hypothetical protein